jgi:RNA polymerase sigma-70 factor (ECF subfamily)
VWRVAYSLTGRRADADDVAQDTFTIAITNLGRFEQRSSFRTWVTRIAINTALNLLRSDRVRCGLWQEAVASPEEPNHLRGEILAALATLSLERRTVVVLRYWLGFAVAEIAQLLGIPEGTVNSRLARGVRELRSQLEVSCHG